MRIWSGEGGLMTDEQVLAYIGHFGSLSEAAQHGDIDLLHEDGTDAVGQADGADALKRARGHRSGHGKRLADYLEG